MKHKSKLATHEATGHARPRMASLRISTKEDPDRHDRIAKKLRVRGSSISIYGRALFEALEQFIDKNDKLPRLPLRIAEDSESSK